MAITEEGRKIPPEFYNRVNWMMKIAQEDLEKWQDYDCAQAMVDLRRFMPGSGEAPWLLPSVQSPKDGSEDYTEVKRWLNFLQNKIRAFMESLLLQLKKMKNVPKTFSFPVKGHLTYYKNGEELRPVYSTDQSDKQTFCTALLFQLADDLTRVNLKQVRTCRYCGKYFLAFGKQEYDTPLCSSRARKKRAMEESTRPTTSTKPTKKLSKK